MNRSPPAHYIVRDQAKAAMAHHRTIALFDVDGTLTVPRKVRVVMRSALFLCVALDGNSGVSLAYVMQALA